MYLVPVRIHTITALHENVRAILVFRFLDEANASFSSSLRRLVFVQGPVLKIAVTRIFGWISIRRPSSLRPPFSHFDKNRKSSGFHAYV